MSFTVPKALESELDELTTHYPEKRSASLMFLHALQEHFGYLSREAMEWTAQKLELKPLHVYELVTFYPMFRQEPLGKTHIRICRTLSCAMEGSKEVRSKLCNKLGLNAGSHLAQTTADGKYTVEFVECLAACGSAPVVLVNDQLREKVKPEDAEKLL